MSKESLLKEEEILEESHLEGGGKIRRISTRTEIRK
jgi:hypothetical protein